MSIIAALVSTRTGIVGSDGRIISSAYWENGVCKAPAHILRDDFDKTFTLAAGKVVGAFSGLVEFSGQTVGEHIQDITRPLLERCNSFEIIIDTIQVKLCERLENIDPAEVGFDFRKVDLILVGGRRLARKDVRIATIRFAPCNGRIEGVKEVRCPGVSNIFQLFGDDAAQQGARGVLDANRSPNRNANYLAALVRESIEAGIRSTGNHNACPQPACGGDTFVRQTEYTDQTRPTTAPARCHRR